MGNSVASPESMDQITEKHVEKLKETPSKVRNSKQEGDAAKYMTKCIQDSESFALQTGYKCIFTGFDSEQYTEALEYYGIESKLYEFDKYAIKVGDRPFQTKWLRKEKGGVSISGLGDYWSPDDKTKNITEISKKELCGLELVDSVDTIFDIIDATTDIGYGLVSQCGHLNTTLAVLGGFSLVCDLFYCVAAQSKKESDKEGTKSSESGGCMAFMKPSAYFIEYGLGIIIQSIIIGSGVDNSSVFAQFLGYLSFVISVILGVIKGWNLKYQIQLLCAHGCDEYDSESRAAGRNCMFCVGILLIPVFGILAFTALFEGAC